jgi:CRISPR-associated protein Cmr1
MTKQVEIIHATYDIVTPLFCGGVQADTAELRLPSFKGVLRWHWRAVVWQALGQAMEAIQKEEAAMFGSPGGGQGKVCMRQLRGGTQKGICVKDVLKDTRGRTVGMGARYLGYGVMEAFGSEKKRTKDGELTRGCLVPPLALAIELRCRGLEDQERARLLLALRAVGLLGAMGSKSRKGYGSLVLRELTVAGAARWQAPRTIDELHARIAELRRDCAGSGQRENVEAPYTALTPQSRHVLVAARDPADAIGLLDFVGREIVRYRSWGRDGKVLRDVDREERFKDDHDMQKRAAGGGLIKDHPDRVAFGLPHNYGKGSRNEVTPHGHDLDRRASPLLIHIHMCGAMPVAVLSFLPALFLPEKARIMAFGTPVPVASPPALWTPIEDLLDRFLGTTTTNSRAGERREPFGKAMEVKR